MAVSFEKCDNFAEFKRLIVTPFRAFSVVHVNIRSLRKHWELFKVLVNEVLSRIDVFVLTESNVPEELRDLFQLSGYSPFWYSRPFSLGGGIVVYVKSEWSVTRLDVTLSYAECICLKIENTSHSVGLFACYRPPSRSVRQFLQELTAVLTESWSQGLFFIVGDINIDLLKDHKTEVCDYLNTLATAGLESTVSAPTREEVVAGRLVSSCIDHIMLRTLDTMVTSAVISEKLADHYFVGCQLVWQDVKASPVADRQTVQITDNKILDSLVSSYDWSSLLESASSSNVYFKFVDVHNSFKVRAQKTVQLTNEEQTGFG